MRALAFILTIYYVYTGVLWYSVYDCYTKHDYRGEFWPFPLAVAIWTVLPLGLLFAKMDQEAPKKKRRTRK